MLSKATRRIFQEVTVFGGIIFYLLVILLFLILGKFNHALILFVALVIIYFVTWIIRSLYFKKRPKEMEYKSYLGKLDASSFPSVHAARITFLFLFTLIMFTSNILLVGLALIMCIGVIYSRIYLKKHFITDIIGGIILGIFALVSFLIV